VYSEVSPFFLLVFISSSVRNSTSLGFRQFYEFLQVDWATFLTYSLNMECTDR